MKALILGANGYLGPHVIKALEADHELLITDIKPPPSETPHKFRQVDATNLEQVMDAAEGMDTIINLSVLRPHRVLAFGVNTLGCYNTMLAAVKHKIRRVINTGPHFTVTGPPYEGFDFDIGPDIPPQSGINLYAHSKSLGQEICRVFTEHHDIWVQEYLFYNFRDPAKLTPGGGGVPFQISWDDAGEIFRLGLKIDLDKLPSKCEVFYCLGDMPHGKFSNEKTKRILGFRPKDDLSAQWTRPA
ncbi:MAG: NAD(P)-dependent oxidoreductase [Acidobacteria bacterium]|nr:NAD(P)-dependent oxidoreductase [Acidobacteriota bacterium]